MGMKVYQTAVLNKSRIFWELLFVCFLNPAYLIDYFHLMEPLLFNYRLQNI